MRSYSGQQGFTLIGLLFLIAGLGVAMAALGVVWQTFAQRENEAELLFIGDQYRKALASYQRATPGTAKRYPANLEDLLQDPRFPHTVRHLRRLYRDPMTGGKEWGLARDTDKGIVGVYSLSEKVPRKKAGFALGLESFAEAKTYRDWVFKAVAQSGANADNAANQFQPGQNDANASPISGTPGSASPTTQNAIQGTPQASPQGTTQVDPCVSAYQGQMSICRSSYQNGDLATWRACTSAALVSRMECGKAGGGH